MIIYWIFRKKDGGFLLQTIHPSVVELAEELGGYEVTTVSVN